jgi:hypothetical protein
MNSHRIALSIGAVVASIVGLGCIGDDDDGTGPTVSFYEVMDGSSGPICTFASTDEADATIVDGSTSGTCPYRNRVGCCVATISISSNVEATISATNATCYYSEAAAKAPKAACSGVNDGGFTLTWTTAAP